MIHAPTRIARLCFRLALFDLIFGFIFGLGAAHSLGRSHMLLFVLAACGLWVGWCAEKGGPLVYSLVARGLAYVMVTALLTHLLYADLRSSYVEVSTGALVVALAVLVFLTANAVVSVWLAWRVTRVSS